MAIGTPVAGTAAANTVAGTSLAVPYPAGISADDLLVLEVFVSSATAPTNPTGAGFTSQATNTSGGSSPSFRISTKKATGSESGNITVTTPNATSQGRCWRVSGVDTTTAIDTTQIVFGSSASVTAYTLDGTATSTTRPGVMIFVGGAGNGSTGSWNPPTTPSAFTEVWDTTTTTPASTADYLIWSSSGTVGNIDLSRPGGSGLRGCAGAIFLRPAGTQQAASGTVDAVSAVSGSAALGLPASGTVAGVSGTSGSIDHLLRPVDAQVDVVSGATGAAGYIVAASGTAAAVSGVTGTAALRTPASGTVAAVSGAIGSAAPQLGASGTVAAVSGVTGSAKLLAAATGTATGTTGASGGVALLTRASGTAAAVSAVSGAATARLTVGAAAFNSFTEVFGSAILTTAAVGDPVEVISGVYGSAGVASDISVTAVLDARTWSAALDPRTWEASL